MNTSISLIHPDFVPFLQSLPTADAVQCLGCPSVFQEQFTNFLAHKSEKPPNSSVIAVDLNAPLYVFVGGGKYIVLQNQHETIAVSFVRKATVTCLDTDDVPAPPFMGLSTDNQQTKQHFAEGHVRLCGQLLIDL